MLPVLSSGGSSDPFTPLFFPSSCLHAKRACRRHAVLGAPQEAHGGHGPITHVQSIQPRTRIKAASAYYAGRPVFGQSECWQSWPTRGEYSKNLTCYSIAACACDSLYIGLDYDAGYLIAAGGLGYGGLSLGLHCSLLRVPRCHANLKPVTR